MKSMLLPVERYLGLLSVRRSGYPRVTRRCLAVGAPPVCQLTSTLESRPTL